MAAMDSLSSCGPQPTFQGPPTAHAPKPIVVSSRSVLPSLRFSVIWFPQLSMVSSAVYVAIIRCPVTVFKLHRDILLYALDPVRSRRMGPEIAGNTPPSASLFFL